MARKPKAVASANDDREKLIAALDFVLLATKGNDEGKSAFVAFHNNCVTAENDTLTLGVAVDVGLELCPEAAKFRAALIQCESTFQLTQLDDSAVSIKSGAFRALIPAIAPGMIAQNVPDLPCALINNNIRNAFEACSKTMSKGERVFNKSVLLRSGSAVGTNGGILVEYWHGLDLPGVFGIPKKTVETILGTAKPLYSLGYSDRSITFYFEDGSFLKSRIMSEAWPDVDRLLNSFDTATHAIWPQFFAALKAVQAFVQNDTIHFHANHLGTAHTLELGASFQVPGLPDDRHFSATYWRILEPYIDHVKLGLTGSPTSFTGRNVRGLIMGKTA